MNGAEASPAPAPRDAAAPAGQAPSAAPARSGTARAVYLVLAAVFFALAAFGVFLPVLPTTPFLLLTSACLVRSSPRLHGRLRASRLFGPFLSDWERHRGVRLHVKLVALTTLALVAGTTLFAVPLPPAVRVVAGLLVALGAAVVLRLRTIPRS